MAKRKKRITSDDTLGILGDPPDSDQKSRDDLDVSSSPPNTKAKPKPTVDETSKGKATTEPSSDVGSETTDSAVEKPVEKPNDPKSSSSPKKKRKSKASKKKPKPVQDEHSDIPTLYTRKRDGLAVGSMQITLPKKLIKMIKAEAVLSSDPNHSVFVARQILGDKYDDFMESIG